MTGDVFEPVPVRVDPRVGPPPPTLVETAPRYVHDDDGPSWPGTVLAWRWAAPDQSRWVALVRYTRPDGLQYTHWLPGDKLTPIDPVPDT